MPVLCLWLKKRWLPGLRDAGGQPSAPRTLLTVCGMGGQLVPELFPEQQDTGYMQTFICIQVECGANLAQEVASLCEPHPHL